jgi:hypothetical protein
MWLNAMRDPNAPGAAIKKYCGLTCYANISIIEDAIGGDIG